MLLIWALTPRSGSTTCVPQPTSERSPWSVWSSKVRGSTRTWFTGGFTSLWECKLLTLSYILQYVLFCFPQCFIHCFLHCFSRWFLHYTLYCFFQCFLVLSTVCPPVFPSVFSILSSIVFLQCFVSFCGSYCVSFSSVSYSSLYCCSTTPCCVTWGILWCVSVFGRGAAVVCHMWWNISIWSELTFIVLVSDLAGEPLCLISSSVESGAELLKVQYFKVMTISN